MRPVCGFPALVPSSSLLRFLRLQVQEGCFSSSSTDTSICNRLNPRPTKQLSCRQKLNTYPLSSRRFITSQYQKANAGSSRLDTDYLGQNTKNIYNPLSLASATWHNTLAPCLLLRGPSDRRHASIGFRHIRNKLPWLHNQRDDRPELKRKDLPPIHSFLEDASRPVIGRSKVGKAANDLKLRCTEWNKNGKVTTVTGEFKKTELIAKAFFHIACCRLSTETDGMSSMAYSLATCERSIPRFYHIS